MTTEVVLEISPEVLKESLRATCMSEQISAQACFAFAKARLGKDELTPQQIETFIQRVLNHDSSHHIVTEVTLRNVEREAQLKRLFMSSNGRLKRL